jgi:membrane-bound lytic murein transglycosylase B
MTLSFPRRRHVRQLITVSSLLVLVACAEKPTAAVATPLQGNAPVQMARSAATVPSAVAQPDDGNFEIQPAMSFSEWQSMFRKQALNAGIRPEIFDSAFAGVTPDMSVVKSDRSQPEFTRPVWEYLDSAISAVRVRKGQALLAQYADALGVMEQRYGVDRQALVAVWGMESSFGQFQGTQSVIRSLATLAYEGRRPQFAQEQLIAALQIIQHGDIDAPSMLGSWAGAMGQTQFIPTTYNTHAVDFDGDGRRDIWNTPVDALASTAHYLQSSGWQKGQPWGFEVQLASGFDYALADASTRKSIADWQQLGLKLPNGSPLPANMLQQQAALLLPAGYKGPAFLVMDNFRAILKYNNSSSYALGIGLLSERFNGGGYVLGSWPRGDRPLSRSERIELQTLLSARQYDAGNPDGIIGSNTRKAIRSAQQSFGWPADGYPTQELLDKLRKP